MQNKGCCRTRKWPQTVFFLHCLVCGHLTFAMVFLHGALLSLDLYLVFASVP